MHRFTRLLLILAGMTSVVLGVVGMFLPVMPTTPFLLLASVCFARSSPSCHHWLMHNPWCGEYLRNYHEGRGMALRQKIITLAILWVSVGYAVGWVIAPLWGRLVMLAVAAGVTLHLARLKNFRPEDEVSPAAAAETSNLQPRHLTTGPDETHPPHNMSRDPLRRP